MPYFSSFPKQNTAKPGVVSDGEVIVVGTDGYTVSSSLSSWTAFHANPARSSAGVWSVQLKDCVQKVIDVHVASMLASTHYLSVQLLPTTTAANGQLILNWVFNSAGTPTDLPSLGSFLVYVMYGE